jgi:hypothetical protein
VRRRDGAGAGPAATHRPVDGRVRDPEPEPVNPLGLSLVRLVGIDGPVVRFAGVDLLDGTPMVDIKPYVGRFDRPDGEPRCGWYDTVQPAPGVRPADLGPVPPGARRSGLG